MKISPLICAAALACAPLAFSPLQVLAEDNAPPTNQTTDKNLPDRNGVRPLTRAAFKIVYAEVDDALLRKDTAASTRYWAPNFQQVDGDGNLNNRARALQALQQSAAQLPDLESVTSQIDAMRRIPTKDGSERYVIEATTTIEADLENAAGTVRKLKAVGHTREVWISVPDPQGDEPIYQQILSIEMLSKTFLDGIEIPL